MCDKCQDIHKYFGTPRRKLGKVEPFIIKDITMTGAEWIKVFDEAVEYIKKKNELESNL